MKLWKWWTLNIYLFIINFLCYSFRMNLTFNWFYVLTILLYKYVIRLILDEENALVFFKYNNNTINYVITDFIHMSGETQKRILRVSVRYEITVPITVFIWVCLLQHWFRVIIFIVKFSKFNFYSKTRMYHLLLYLMFC